MGAQLDLEAVDTFRCPACGQAKGLACVTPRGARRRPHDGRIRLVELRRVEVAKLERWERGAHGVPRS